mgnify:CR=1 FL=1
MNEFFDFIMARVVPALNTGLWVSVQIIVPAALLGVAIGVTAGTLRVYGAKPLAKAMNFYVSLFRGTPLVVQLYFWYFALPYISIGGFNIVLSPMMASIVAFALCSGAYQSEYIRGGLLSIKKGQLTAAQALGFTPVRSVVSIVLPQAFRRALPGCGNEIIYLIKYSSLASIITVNELTGVGRGIAKATWKNTEVFMVVGVYYLILVTVASFILKQLENRLCIPGFDSNRSS